MRRATKFVLALAVALGLMLAFRALVLTVYTVEGSALSPQLQAGDRVLVNRWSYGLRVGSDGGMLGYSRLWSRPVEKGDIVVFNHPSDADQVLMCRCKAVPGDTVSHQGQTLVVPGRHNCADADYYWMEAIGSDNPVDSRQLGFISEKHIIGRAFLVIASHQPGTSIWKGWRTDRFFLPL